MLPASFLLAIMLNPPLSLLSDDLLACIVEHIAKFPFPNNDLYNLSLSDRAFTLSCQRYIFRDLTLRKPSKIFKLKEILDDKPSFSNHVRVVKLPTKSAWLFNNHVVISILKSLASSPMPPHTLLFRRQTVDDPQIIEDPVLVMRGLTQSFFSQTLTILCLDRLDIPLPLFLICPRLREVSLDHVGATESYDEYPDDLCSGCKAPRLEVLDYCDSYSIVGQMITPPPRFNKPVVRWSKLRVLTLSPHEKEEMTCLQPILDTACHTLEELHLTRLHAGECRCSVFFSTKQI